MNDIARLTSLFVSAFVCFQSNEWLFKRLKIEVGHLKVIGWMSCAEFLVQGQMIIVTNPEEFFRDILMSLLIVSLLLKDF
jgi:hypothetical protein